jgi:23S rRNA pseudouridine2605 synthase
VPRSIRPPSRPPGPRRGRQAAESPAPRYGLARVLSKRGVASRSVATAWIRAGRVSVDGRAVTDPEFPIRPDKVVIRLDGQPLPEAPRTYLMLNKPRGLVTSAADEQGRKTVYGCLDEELPWVGPVGRLDMASEGLLLMSNDPAWAARITDPATGPHKTYHVQVDGLPDAEALRRMQSGVDAEGEALAFASVQVLRRGAKQAWLEVVLDEGRNRHIRRTLKALGFEVKRLIRVRIGALALGDLAKGQWRLLSDQEMRALAAPGD